VLDNNLEIEWHDGGSMQFVETPDVVEWLLKLPSMPNWLFVGRLLHREKDAAVLDDSVSLGTEIQTVLCGFKRTCWEEIHVQAQSMK
jgi:hypothetical protein